MNQTKQIKRKPVKNLAECFLGGHFPSRLIERCLKSETSSYSEAVRLLTDLKLFSKWAGVAPDYAYYDPEQSTVSQEEKLLTRWINEPTE